jgi:hypothetical protein
MSESLADNRATGRILGERRLGTEVAQTLSRSEHRRVHLGESWTPDRL